MKKLLLSGSALVAFALVGSAYAADLPVYTKAPPMVPMGYDWSGVYFGGHIGGGWATNDFSDPGLGIIGTIIGVPVVQTTNSSGFLGGIQGGVNYQIGKLVVGAEADFSWADIKGTSTSSFPTIFPFINRTIGANTDWTATATTRIGIAHDHWLFYGKAGVAWARTNVSDNWVTTPIAGSIPLFSGSGSDTRVGWTVGTGLEWAFMNNWSAKIEYDYMDFGQKMGTISGNILPTIFPIPASFGLQNSQQISEVKFGLNYRFMPNFW